MKITRQKVEKLTISGLDKLDPIAVTLDDVRPGAGSITISCFGRSWTASWGAIGEQTVARFFVTSDVQYLADRLSSTPATKIDYDAISERIGHCVDVTNALTFSDQLTEAYGPDWHFDLPTCPNPDYEYLCRIVRAVRTALASDLEQQEKT